MSSKIIVLFLLCITALFASSCSYIESEVSRVDFQTEPIIADVDSITAVPEEYKDVIGAYKQLVTDLFSADFEEKVNQGYFDINGSQELSYDWFCMVIDAKKPLNDFSPNSFGYSLCDLDGDNIEELILLREDYYVLAIYTTESSQAKLLGAYSYNHRATILDNGIIYTLTTEAADIFMIRLLELKHGGLVVTDEFGSDRDSETERSYFYRVTDGIKKSISEEEYAMHSPDIMSIFDPLKAKDRMNKNGIEFSSIADH